MDKITSADDLEIYKDDSNFRILAGPGAGKTHLLIENIKHIVKNSKRLKTNNKRKILCITYTNAAVAEISQRLGSFSKYVVVSTIHSFINEYIISPFQQQLKLHVKNNFDIEVPQNIKISSVQEGFTVLSGHPKDDIYAWIQKNYPNISDTAYNSLSRKKMGDVGINIKAKNSYPFDPSATVSIKTLSGGQENISKIIKEYIWAVAGKLSFDEILYFGLSLMEDYPIVLHMLRAEFPYVLMDEYQDTNPIQNRILDLMSQKESSVVVVGDIAQSIYAFQGATYHEFKDFKLHSPNKIQTKAIEGNRRSTQNIINLLNFIRKDDTEFKQECSKNKEQNEKIIFFIQKEKTASSPISECIEKDTKILCRKWAEAFNYIDDVSADQKKLINDIYNAYTYSANRDMAQEIENKREAWISSALDIAALEIAFDSKNIPAALKIFEKYIDIKDIFKDFKKDKLQNLKIIINVWENLFSNDLNDYNLKALISLINEKIKGLEGISILELFRYPNKEDEDYFEAVYKHVDNITYSCAKKIVLELFAETSKHMTIHKAKGKEFDSVLVNLEPFSRGDEKDFNPASIFITPQIINTNNPVYEEYVRIAYVGCSRAKNKLYIHLKGNETTAMSIKSALNSYYKDNPEKQDFFDFIYC